MERITVNPMQMGGVPCIRGLRIPVATVVGMVDALADIFTMADKWIIDGILARVSAALVAASGTVLRAFQTGRVQAYSAAMVIGLAGVGWFMVRPHASATVDDRNLRGTLRRNPAA